MTAINQELLAPPRLTGDSQQDYAALINYLWSFYRVVHGNYALRTPMLDALAPVELSDNAMPNALATHYLISILNTSTNDTAALVALTDFSKLLLEMPTAGAMKSLLSAADVEVKYSFNLTLTGCTTSPSVACFALKTGSQVTLHFTGLFIATSNATTKTLTGLPAALWPVSDSAYRFSSTICGDNGGPYQVGMLRINTNGTIDIFPLSPVPTILWTASGTCYIHSDTFTYLL